MPSYFLSLSLSLSLCVHYLRLWIESSFFLKEKTLLGGFPFIHSENQVIHDSFFPVFGP